jgi:hypothetical protein
MNPKFEKIVKFPNKTKLRTNPKFKKKYQISNETQIKKKKTTNFKRRANFQ